MLITELQYWSATIASLVRSNVSITPYEPEIRRPPTRNLQIESAWTGIESILADLIDRFHIGSSRCLEFGVEYGYSTVALSSFFESVIGVDIFAGDQHTLNKRDIYDETVGRLSAYENIRLVRSSYEDWIKHDDSTYDLIHVDIVHTYGDTFACGLWSATHSQCAIFHDTESFPAVKRAVIEIARRTGKRFYNFKECNGLGILV